MRTPPLQSRSSLRIATFLDAAAEILAQVGYDALTMTAVAERAGASIGALYRWFPDKATLAQELRNRYGTELEALLAELFGEAPNRTVPEFAAALIDEMARFTQERPAWLALLGTTPRPSRTPEARRGLRESFASVFQAYAPHLTAEQAFLVANVSLEIVKGLAATFRHATEIEREGLTRQFKIALTLYLSEALGTAPPL